MSTTVKRAETPQYEGTERTRTGFKGFMARHAVAIYYVLAFAISWGGIVFILDRLFSTGTTMPFSGGAALLAGPPIAGVLLTGLVDGRSGLRLLLSRLRRWRVGARWYAVALLTGPLVMGGTVFASALSLSAERAQCLPLSEGDGQVPIRKAEVLSYRAD
jgi:hypothetical protein